MYPKSFMLEIADCCFAFIDHNGKSDIFCAFKQISLQAFILNLIKVQISGFGPGFLGLFLFAWLFIWSGFFLLNTDEFHVAGF